MRNLARLRFLQIALFLGIACPAAAQTTFPSRPGTIGKARVASARPDGHSIVLGGNGSATLPALYRRLPFDPVAAFEPVGLINEVPLTLVVRRNFPAATLQEFTAMARRDGERLNLGHSGLGSTGQLCGLLLHAVLGARLTEVPYRGAALIMNDLVAGTLDVTCDQTTNTAGQIRAGSIRALAVTTQARVAALPAPVAGKEESNADR